MEGHAHVEPGDTFGRNVGILVAMIALVLSTCTILAHRSHTDTIIFANKSSDTWAQYQAKRIRSYQIEMNAGLVKLLAANNPSTETVLAGYEKQSKKYEGDLEEIKSKAESFEAKEQSEHHKATLFDLAEGLLELAMILSSLYFIAHKKFFPQLGAVMGIAGLAIGILGLLAH